MNNTNIILKVIKFFFIIILISFIFESSLNSKSSNLKGATLGNILSIKSLNSSSLSIAKPFIKNYRITSRFGKRIHPTTRRVSFHDGLDYGAPEGTKLISILSGNVIFSGFKGPYGYTTIIKCGNLSFQYSHMNPNLMLKVGAKVESGDIIGEVGPKYVKNGIYKDSTGMFTNGRTTGPHLHYSIKKNGMFVNPLSLK